MKSLTLYTALASYAQPEPPPVVSRNPPPPTGVSRSRPLPSVPGAPSSSRPVAPVPPVPSKQAYNYPAYDQNYIPEEPAYIRPPYQPHSYNTGSSPYAHHPNVSELSDSNTSHHSSYRTNGSYPSSGPYAPRDPGYDTQPYNNGYASGPVLDTGVYDYQKPAPNVPHKYIDPQYYTNSTGVPAQATRPSYSNEALPSNPRQDPYQPPPQPYQNLHRADSRYSSSSNSQPSPLPNGSTDNIAYGIGSNLLRSDSYTSAGSLLRRSPGADSVLTPASSNPSGSVSHAPLPGQHQIASQYTDYVAPVITTTPSGSAEPGSSRRRGQEYQRIASMKGALELHEDEEDEDEDEDPDEDRFVNLSLLSHLANRLRDRVPRGTHVKGSIPYPGAFTGKDIVVCDLSIVVVVVASPRAHSLLPPFHSLPSTRKFKKSF